MKWLVFGSNGWIGSMVCKLLSDGGHDVIKTSIRADNEQQVEEELLLYRPDRVVCLIGRTHGDGINTIDYLELPGKLKENIKDNLYAPMVLVMLCVKHNIHLTYLGTGCIFDGQNAPNSFGYYEDDEPDFCGSSYSTVKGFTDRLMHFFDRNVLNVRIRMPIDNRHHPRNFVTKIMNYERICSIPNSMTVLPELLPIMLDMATNKTMGTINLTNPGIISHNEILTMAKEILDPEFTWKNFTLEEQSKVIGGRSNNKLNTDLLSQMYPQVRNIHDAVRATLIEMKAKAKIE